MGWPEFIVQIESASSYTLGEEDMILPSGTLMITGWVAQHRLSKSGTCASNRSCAATVEILQADPP